MPFMVIYSTSDGASCHEQTDAIDEAALLVERLRNKDAIEEVRIYRMEEIGFAFRPYYKVELGMADRQATPPAPEVLGAPLPRRSRGDEPVVLQKPAPEVQATVKPAPAAEPAKPAAPAASAASAEATSPYAGDPNSANGRRGLFGR